MIKNILLLLRIQLLDLFGINKAIHTKDKREKLKLWSLMAVFTLSMIIVTGVSFMYSYNIAMALEMFGVLELLPIVMMVATCLTTLVTSIYKVSGVLFGFKDYDMLMSLPIKTSTIISSRIIMLNIINIFYTLIIMIPAGIVYSVKASPDFIFYIIYVVTLFFIPFVPIILATAVGYVISYISSRFKHTNIINIILSILIMIVLIGAPYLSNSASFDIANIKETIIHVLNEYYPLASLYADAVLNYSISSMIMFMIISASLFLIFISIIAHKFKSINTTLSAKPVSSNYKLSELKQSSQFFALYKKEMRRYFSSALYVLNTAFGIVFLTFISVGIIIFGFDKMAQMLDISELTNMINVFAPVAISAFIALSCTTSCSISLEGINLWIVKAIPVKTETIFLSKIAVNLTVLIPAILIDSTLISIALHSNIIETIFIYITPISYALFISIAGIVINLHLPKLDWVSEVTVIKQSAATFTAMIVGLGSIAIPITIILKLPQIDVSMVVITTTACIAIINIFMYRYICVKGIKIFNQL